MPTSSSSTNLRMNSPWNRLSMKTILRALPSPMHGLPAAGGGRRGSTFTELSGRIVWYSSERDCAMSRNTEREPDGGARSAPRRGAPYRGALRRRHRFRRLLGPRRRPADRRGARRARPARGHRGHRAGHPRRARRRPGCRRGWCGRRSTRCSADAGADAVKIGMLASAPIVRAVAAALAPARAGARRPRPRAALDDRAARCSTTPGGAPWSSCCCPLADLITPEPPRGGGAARAAGSAASPA